MSAPPAGSVASPAPPDALELFIAEVRRTGGPVAELTGTALAYLGPTGTVWITPQPACACSNSAAPPRCVDGQGLDGRQVRTFEVSCRGCFTGKLAVCGPAGNASLETTLRYIAEHILRWLTLEHDKESLQEELSASWENLEAVYDITSQLRAAESANDLLERILAKAVIIQPGVKIVLWLENEGQLEPVVAKNVEACEPRSAREGMLGKALAEGKTIVAGRQRMAAMPNLEPELRNAQCVAVVPIATRQLALGALLVWEEKSDGALEFHLMHLLDTLATLAATVVENDRLHRAALDSERLKREVEIGSRIQQTLLLGRPPVNMKSLKAAAMSIPSSRIDGDFYDFYEHNQSLDVIVGDVMGKGIPAALVGAATKSHYLRAMNSLLAKDPNVLPLPKDILTILNAELVKQLVGIERFVTLCYARFDLRKNRLEFVDCGHTKPIYYCKATGLIQMLQGFNMPLGFSEDDVYEQVSVPFGPGDVFFFYSDGITESKNAAGVLFGEQRLANLIDANHEKDPGELIDCVRKEIMAYSKMDTFIDDLTGVAVKIVDWQAPSPLAAGRWEITSDLADLPRLRNFLRELTRRTYDASTIEEELWELELAATEALSNIMRHAFRNRPAGKIRVEVELYIDKIVLRFFHQGDAFTPPTEVLEPDGTQENSMGLFLIQRCVDQVQYLRDAQGENCVELTKKFKKPEQKGA